jgi:hypothetical protein
LCVLLGVLAAGTANVVVAPALPGVSDAGTSVAGVSVPVAQLIAGWPALAVLLTVELLARYPVRPRPLSIVRAAAATSVAGAAAWLSYWDMVVVARRYGGYGDSGVVPYLLPVTVDGLIVVAAVSLIEVGARIREAEQAPAPAGRAGILALVGAQSRPSAPPAPTYINGLRRQPQEAPDFGGKVRPT